MCYLLAKKFDEQGCLAMQAESGKKLAALVSFLTEETLEKDIQIVTISDMEAFGEYKPYTLIASKSQFIDKVLQM